MTHGIALILGAIIGASCLFGAYIYKNRFSTVLTAKRTIYAGNGIIVPKGTEMVYEHGLPEGVECVKLFINMTPSFARESLETKKDNHSFLVIPYWVDETKSN